MEGTKNNPGFQNKSQYINTPTKSLGNPDAVHNSVPFNEQTPDATKRWFGQGHLKQAMEHAGEPQGTIDAVENGTFTRDMPVRNDYEDCQSY